MEQVYAALRNMRSAMAGADATHQFHDALVAELQKIHDAVFSPKKADAPAAKAGPKTPAA